MRIFKPSLLKVQSLILLVFLIGMLSCEKSNNNNPEEPTSMMEEMSIPQDFDFKTTRDVTINISVLDNSGSPMVFIPIEVYKSKVNSSGLEIGDDVLVFKGFTDVQGNINSEISLATSIESLKIKTNYLGLINESIVPINGDQLAYSLGGLNNTKSTGQSNNINQGYYYTLGSWNGLGVPNYLVTPGDNITQDFLDDINASLPEALPLPVSHPMYFQSTTEYAIHLTEMAEVWVTFVHEGAGWTNALGYYTYTEGNAPATVLDITDLTLIFPNTSFAGSGGGLYAGDKVYLGTFAANTVIEWFQVAQGWNNTQDTVGHGVYTHYSQAHLNIESDPGLRQHNILLYDATRELILLGFEDIDRESYICDHDFNDAIFYATVTPFTAVDPQNLPPIDTPDDTDNDGVSDAFDEYPTDPDRAYNFWLPGEGEFGTLAFEDLWPEKGDYDFNDIVIDYQYQIVASASNELVEAFAKYVLQATGASYHNGFGIELPLLPSQIASVTGGDYSTGLTNRAANGTETGQTNAVIIAFEDGFSLLAYPGTGIGVNTSPGSTWVEPDTLTQMISFVSGITLPNIGTTPFNPFIFANQNRGIEVHLIDNPPTNLADMLLFGTADDNSSPMYGQFYKTQNLLPWAIHIPESFDYPIEKEEVNQAHLKFTDWAESGGILYPDWYQNKSGYRNAALIY